METFVRATVATGAKTLDASWYTSPEAFAKEQERIFARHWLCVGRQEQIERPGDFFTAQPAGESLIVTRDSAGAIHAFYNVCRHRGTRICESAAGHFQGSIQCPYHAWTYALDGALKAARNMTDVPGFSRDDYPLKQAQVALWEGFIFVNLDPQAPPFDRSFAPLLERFANWQVASLRTARSITYDLACNWKLVFLNYSECYHCPLVHPQLDKLSPSDSGRNDLVEGAFLGGYSELRHDGTSLTTTGHTSRPPLGTVTGDDVNRIYYYTIFPSMLLSLHPDYVMVHYAKPLSPDRTEVVCSWLFDPQTMARSDFDPSDAVDFWDLTNRQDWHVNELTHLGMHSRGYSPGPYSNAEGLLSAFDRHYLHVMGV
ncbi:MAG TPA: aromatic ring-hydroxylating dioxygenase subunit alpha, partial [Candidatus Baltobacteraceae bacterium]|nr:aromatic ring-hydroxylating dioxygenase subunit alpha [Candidatus Baltobacteraceae bacterium]